MKKPKLLCILHVPPPIHGAAKVGEFITRSELVLEAFDCRYIAIKSSDSIADIGKFRMTKIVRLATLFFQVLWALVLFRPEKIYFTASIKGFAIYRDIVLSILWKAYRIVTRCDVFYHYHTKGVREFIEGSSAKKRLTEYFVRNNKIILLGPALKGDFEDITTADSFHYLANGVVDCWQDKHFNDFVTQKFETLAHIDVLFLSNMIKSKGYFKVLELAKACKGERIRFHFAGSWQNDDDQKEFEQYIAEHGLEESIVYHGFVSGSQKEALLKASHIFVFPTRYESEAFPLCILEAFSFGIPVVASDEAAIPDIIDARSGVVMSPSDRLQDAFSYACSNLVNKEVAQYCRSRFKDNFSLQSFENNFVAILSGRSSNAKNSVLSNGQG